ncbi:leucine--tRNA ligase [Halococcoides cellulosivorans]|uniref:Leucine--tRNA ligase n=1 Tax=Halococcoides cellulosivorans TaxID=1679096 RepID=A0A2R4X1Q8_9EURY|nr:leucine--tRNA ligase [Halococcoides cellulosivorans]AWB27727.1 leucine--tRNA ligase [Halococcoides cellulosivorans]
MADEITFDHTAIEPAAREAWEGADVFRVPDDAEDPMYVLAMFPYTSGNIHMGHVRNYSITDTVARFERMRGEEVLHPMGWDSFGLPAENAAERRDTDPEEWTLQCIEDMREDMTQMGFGYDWDREVRTCDPDYYRWNQWLFTRFREEGLLERKAGEINWCPDCETVLADEQVEEAGDDEVCWRCESPVEDRELNQWYLQITDYADELLDALDDLDGWPENVCEMQRNWIGRQEGTRVTLEVPDYSDVTIFTTRLDTIHGATYLALSPGHDLAQTLAAEDDDVAEYVERADGADLDETSGVATDAVAINPATGEQLPIYVADYVLDDVGTGALYAVPAHDDRDHAFAEAHDLPIRQVVEPAPDAEPDPDAIDVQEAAYTADGVLVNSGDYDGLDSASARDRLVEDLDGEWVTEYRLRDWLISRQRYWGTPIPIVDCPDCGHVSVPDEDLPVELPEFVQTTGNPLDEADEWRATTCPECGGPAERETDTMDTFVDSSWYFLRYCSPDLADAPFDTERASDWMPVDRYVGGIEHAVMHLLYARFFTKVLDDIDLLEGVREPFADLTNQGMVLLDGEKMSKSKGNVVQPTEIVEEYGADTARLFIMSAAQPEKDFDWTEEGVRSANRLLQRTYRLVRAHEDGSIATGDRDEIDAYVERELDATIATVTEEFEAFRFNHALQAVRELIALIDRYRDATDPAEETLDRALRTIVKLLGPVAPHIAEHCWDRLDGEDLLASADWPTADRPDDYEITDRLIENTRADVRDIVDVAGIEDPETIRLAIAPDWTFEAHAFAREFDGSDPMGALMGQEYMREHGQRGADVAQDLAAEVQSLAEQADPARERTALERAAWLIESEFDAPLEILDADAAGDWATDARPGRPAIDIEA